MCVESLQVYADDDDDNNKYPHLARELKNMMEHGGEGKTIVISALRTILKGLVKGLEDLEIIGQIKTIQTTALLRLAWILRRVLET